MKRHNRDDGILLHISEHCERIQASLSRFGNDFETFQNDNDLRDSVSMNLLQIGELAKKLSDEFISTTQSDMNWRAIIGMRNLFAHDYGSMDIERIWETAVNDTPVLLDFCNKQLNQ